MNKIIKLSKNPNSKEFKEELYRQYQDNNYGLSFLKDISTTTDLSIKELKHFILEYALEELGMDENKFEKFKSEEREKNKEFFLGKKNILLEKYGIDTNFMFRNVEEKHLFLSELYNLLNEDNCSIDKCKELSKEYNIPIVKFILYMKEFILEDLNKKDEDITNNERLITNFELGDLARINNTTLLTIYRKIIDAKNVKEIDDIVNESKLERGYIKNNFIRFKHFYKEEDVKKFNYHFYKYMEKVDQKKKENKTTIKKEKVNNKLFDIREEAAKIIIKYLEDRKYIFDEFLIVNNISREKFFEYVESIKNYNPELYKKYEELKEDKDKQNEENKERIREKIENGVHFGYEENGVHRDFDVIDYLLITKIPVTRMNQFGFDKMNREAKNYLTKYRIHFKYAEKDNNIEIRDIMNNPKLVSVERDEKGNIIPDSEVYLTDEERDNIISFIRKNDLALNRITFNVAFKRYLGGFIEKNNNKKLTLNN